MLTPVSIFVGHYLKEFYIKFHSIVLDSLSQIKILENFKNEKEKLTEYKSKLSDFMFLS